MSLNKFTDNSLKPWLKIHASEIICPQGIKKDTNQTHTFVAPTLQNASNDGQFLAYNHTTKETEWKPLSGPDSLTFISTWDADTNTPNLQSGIGQKNNYYVVQNSINQTSTVTTIDGISSFSNADWIIFNGTLWNKIDNQNNVKSVNGKVGTVTLSHNDLTDIGTLTHDQLETKISSIEGVNTTQSTQISTLQNDNTTQNNRLTNLENKDVVHDTRLTTNEGNISSNIIRLTTLENKTQNIDQTNTDGTKTTFNNKVVIGNLEQNTNLPYVYNNDPTGSQINTGKDNSIPTFDTDGKKIQHSNMYVQPDNGYGSVFYNDDLGSNANCFFGKNQVASGFNNVHIGKNISAGGINNSGNVLLGSFLKSGDGEYNIAIGGNAGPVISNTTGNQNISIGNSAGNSLNTGVKNIFIGSQSQANIDSTNSIGIGQATVVRRNDEAVINSTILRPNADAVCDLGTSSTDPLHTSRYKDLYLSGKVDANESFTNTSTSVLYRSSQYFDSIGNSGFFMGVGANGTIQINKTTYQGTAGAIMKLSANGTIEKSGVTIDASNNVQTLGYVQAPIVSATTGLSTEKITNFDSPIPTTAITIAPTTANLTFASSLYANGTANKIPHIGSAGELLVSTATVTASGNIDCNEISTQKVVGTGGGPSDDLELLNSDNAGIQIKATTGGLINFSQDEYNLTGNKGKLLKLSTGSGQDVGDVRVSTIEDDASGNVKFSGTPYTGVSNVMTRLNTDGTVERTNINIDGAGLNNITNCNTMSALSVASSNILNSSNLFSPNMFLGLQGGGTASAGQMDINSGNIINTGDISPITDNTEDIGSLALSYKDIHIKGDIYKNGIIYGGGGGGSSITGITSVDNGAGDIEISFTGTDYKTNGYLTVDTNGRIQVTPAPVSTNIEWANIVSYWQTQSGNTSGNVSAILLKNGVVPGTWTQNDFIYLRYTVGTTTNLVSVDSWSPYAETIVTQANVQNAKRIYAVDPGWTTDAQLIRGRMLDEFSWFVAPISAVDQVWVADPNNWNENLSFYAIWRYSGTTRTSENSFLGSSIGFSYGGNVASIPAGYTRIL